MKKLMILTVAILLAGAGTGYAQPQDANSRKMARKQMKAEQDARDRLAFEEARKAIEAKEFVLEADQVSFKSGSTAHVSSNTNFVAVQGDKAVVQVAFDIPVSGPNGLGGVTVSGSTSDYRQSVDKKGNIRVSMNVIGTGISAQVYINLPNGGNQASVDISPNFNSRRITLRGCFVRTDYTTEHTATGQRPTGHLPDRRPSWNPFVSGPR